MAGGTWTGQNKVRPGAYINVMSNSLNTTIGGSRGVVTLPWIGGFGPTKEIIELTPSSNFLNLLGYEFGASELLTVREALKNASRLLLFRVNDGVKATAKIENLTVTAVHSGVRGNAITVRVVADIDNQDMFMVQTFIDSNMVDTQIVANIDDLQANNFVVFSGAGELVANAGTRLSGGLNNPTTSADYASYFEALETDDFNVMAVPIADNPTKQLAVNFIQRSREDEGRKCQLVVSGVSADSEAVINVKNGVILEDGTVVSSDRATAWVAGVTAGANVNESNTYRNYEGAVDVTDHYTNSEIISALQNGEFVFVEKRGQVLVEQDINSLTTFTIEKNEAFSKNRVMRVIDDIANNVKTLFEEQFIGKVTNNAQGRNIFRSAVIEYMDSLQSMGAIEDFVTDDVQVQAGANKDAVVADLRVKPTDAMEKLYMTVIVE